MEFIIARSAVIGILLNDSTVTKRFTSPPVKLNKLQLADGANGTISRKNASVHNGYIIRFGSGLISLTSSSGVMTKQEVRLMLSV